VGKNVESLIVTGVGVQIYDWA